MKAKLRFELQFCQVSHKGPSWSIFVVCVHEVLLSVYMNDISTDIDSEIRLFADDCACYREIRDTEDFRRI